jgi:hypothetical protein
MPRIKIRASGLWTHGDAPSERLPLTQLERRGELGHVHGRLSIEIDGREVPHLGFFGPDDVCFNAWLVELSHALAAVAEEAGEHTFDECEQGQPAFKFVRVRDMVSFSIVASVLSGSDGDSGWSDVRVPYGEFRDAVLSFVEELKGLLAHQAPSAWERWWPSEASSGT